MKRRRPRNPEPSDEVRADPVDQARYDAEHRLSTESHRLSERGSIDERGYPPENEPGTETRRVVRGEQTPEEAARREAYAEDKE